MKPKKRERFCVRLLPIAVFFFVSLVLHYYSTIIMHYNKLIKHFWLSVKRMRFIEFYMRFDLHNCGRQRYKNINNKMQKKKKKTYTSEIIRLNSIFQRFIIFRRRLCFHTHISPTFIDIYISGAHSNRSLPLSLAISLGSNTYTKDFLVLNKEQKEEKKTNTLIQNV